MNCAIGGLLRIIVNKGEEDRGPAQPSFSYKTSDYWAQSVSIGLEFRF